MRPLCMPNVSSRNSHVDVDLDGFEYSLDAKFGISITGTTSVKKVMR